MNFDFSNEEILFIYGHFKKKIKKMEEYKNSADFPISKENLNQDISLYTSITEKIKASCPELAKVDKYI